MQHSWKITLLNGLARVLAVVAIIILMILAVLAVVTALPFVLLVVGTLLILLLAGKIAYHADEFQRIRKRAQKRRDSGSRFP